MSVLWPEIDWARPWLAPHRDCGEKLLADALDHGVPQALNLALERMGGLELHAGRLHFVPQSELPVGEAYEAFIARTACVPTRENPHDFFNGLMWLSFPRLKRRLNELQAQQIAAGGLGAQRGAVRDALTLFDENAAWIQAPSVLIDALRCKDWRALFIEHRASWRDAQLTLFGHALLEKLLQPRKPITAHVWVVPTVLNAEPYLVESMTPEHLAEKPFLAMPVLGVPGWWPANEEPGFYDDPAVFRHGGAQTTACRTVQGMR